jgi:large repetitive protein
MIGNFAHIGVLIALFQLDGIAPDLQMVTPPVGPVAGGTMVTLDGANFQSGATVTFDGIPATMVSFVSSMRLTARTPAHPVFGPVDVAVTNPDTQSSTLAGGYTYRLPTPTLTGVTPNTGTASGSRVVMLSGTNFAAGATVAFGGVAATEVTVLSGTSIRATTPGGSPGPVNVTVTNPDSQVATRANGYTYTLLTIDAITPTVGSIHGGAPFTLTGSAIDQGCKVYFDTTVGVDIIVVDSTTITGIIPPHNAGSVNLVLKPPDPGTISDVIVGGFRYDTPPSLTSLDRSSGPEAGGTQVTLAGSDFAAGATVSFGGLAAISVTFVSSTQLIAVTPNHDAGTVNVVVTNPDGLSGTLVGAFTFGAAPRVDRVNPSTGPIEGGTLVAVSGANFQPGAVAQFGGTTSSATSVIDDSNLMAISPAHVAGVVDVAVTNPDGQSATLLAAFNYGSVPPVLRTLSPSSGPLSGGTQVTLSGDNFSPGAAVSFGGANATNVNVSTATITATTPSHAAGMVDVVVTNSDGQSATMPASFAYRSDAAPPMDQYIDPTTVGPKGCGTAGALPSILGLSAALLWLTRRSRRAQRGTDSGQGPT